MTGVILAYENSEYKPPAIEQSHSFTDPLALIEAADLALCLLVKLDELAKIAAWQLADNQEAYHAR